MMKKQIWNILPLLLAAVFLFSAWQVVKLALEYRGGTESYDALQQYISTGVPELPQSSKETEPEQKPEDPTQESAQEMTEAAPAESSLPIQVDFEALQQVNPDIVGWIYIEGTQINYPVVQGDDNSYYLTHLFDGSYNRSGCIFMDAECFSDFSGQNNILHGHHMKNGSMFAGIRKYRTQSYYDEHPVGILLTPEGSYQVEFFSGYVVSTSDDAWDKFFSDEEFEAWLNKLQKKSRFESDVVPGVNDRILTLSTCSYEYDNARFVLHGVLVDEER